MSKNRSFLSVLVAAVVVPPLGVPSVIVIVEPVITIVEGIVRNHGGEISLASRAGEGTTVTVRWPQIPKAARPHPPENRLYRTMA